MFKQTEEKYKDIKMGDGTGSLYLFGCFTISLCNGLNQKGYDFTPESFNEFLGSNGTNRPVKSPDAWVGVYDNYIDVISLHNYFPTIFNSFQQIDLWNDAPKGDALIKDNLVVLGRVSAAPIGGNGDHFVLITGFKDGVVTIFDPWSGVEEPITKRWGKVGNILGLRIFDVNKKAPVATVPTVNDQTLLDTPSDGQIEFGTVKSLLSDRKRDLAACQAKEAEYLQTIGDQGKLIEDLKASTGAQVITQIKYQTETFPEFIVRQLQKLGK